MIKIIELDENGLSPRQLMDSLDSPEGAMLRQNGHIIARIKPAEDADLEDELWTRQPEQIERMAAARVIPSRSSARASSSATAPTC